jgi:hypothetical protein
MRRTLMPLVVGATLLALSACSSDGSRPSAGSTSTSASSRTSTTTRPSGTGGTTAWVDVSATWKAMTPSALSTDPHQVAEDLATLRRGQDTSSVGEVSVASVSSGEPAVIVLVETGGADDAVATLETEITLEPGEGGWTVGTARQRATCYQPLPSPDATTCPPIG